MLKRLTLSAALIALLCPTLRAGTLEGAFAAGSAAARKFETNVCNDNKELEKMVFRFKLEGKNGSGSLDVRFSFLNCVVTDEMYDHHGATPKALRVFKGDIGDYELFIETEQDSTDSEVFMLQGQKTSKATWLGMKPTVDLLTKRIDYASVYVLNYQGKTNDDYMLIGPAFLLSYDPSPKPTDPDGPTGCQ